MTAADRYYLSIKQDRYDWRDDQPQRCMKCLKRFGGFRRPEIHEIERRAQAPKNWAQRCNYLLLCNPCHWDMDDAEQWPHARQLALKRRMDPVHFDMRLWLAIKPRPETYVTLDDISWWDERRSA